jgi:hypothetical protein
MLFKSEYYLWDPYVKYRDFLFSCIEKKYDPEQILHNHHIIPRHMGIDNSKENLISLSVSDHIKAHILLADCFEEGSIERTNNLKSARVLNKNSDIDKETLTRISESFKGAGNPFYGKKHTEESILKIKNNHKEILKDKNYDEIYQENSSIEREKRRISVKKYWDNITEEEKSKRISKCSESMRGKMVGDKNPFSTPVLVDGIRYPSITAAAKDKGISQPLLFKRFEVIKLNKK